MSRFTTLTLIGLLAALPALADEGVGLSHPLSRTVSGLVPGGMDPLQGDKQTELLTGQGLSLGTVSPLAAPAFALTAPAFLPHTSLGRTADKLAMGGYVAYSFDNLALSSSLKTKNNTSTANLSARYPSEGLGLPGTASVTLGYDWQRASTFSINPRTPGQDLFDPNPHGTSLSLSWDHAITPSLYLGGYASAIRTVPAPDDLGTMTSSNLFRVGAGLGLKF